MKKYSNEIKMVLFIIIASLLVWIFNSCTYHICDCKKSQTKIIWYGNPPYGYKKLPWDFLPDKDPWSNIEPKCTLNVIKHIDSGVGIGTTAPNYKLRISKTPQLDTVTQNDTNFKTSEIKPSNLLPIGTLPITSEISPIGTNPMPVEISPIGTEIGIYHPDSGRVIRIRIGNAEHEVNYPNPKYSPNIRGFKNAKDTLR